MNCLFLSEFINDNSAVLVITDVNRRYLSGFNSSLGFLLLHGSDKILFVDGRYFTAATKAVDSDIKVVLMNNLFEQLNLFIKEQNVKRLFVESEISVGEFNNIVNKLECNVEACAQLSEALLEKRSVKDEFELESIIKAQEITEKAFDEILNYIKVGVSERDIATELEYIMKKLGSSSPAFDTICVSGANSALPHGVPCDKSIHTGDFVTMDFGAVFNGYRSDMTRTVAVSYVTDEMLSVYNTVLEAQNKAIEAVKSGALCCDIDKAARDVIDSAGYKEFFNHSTGHGVGLDIHEYPTVSAKCEKELKVGQVITCEPGIYIPEKLGVRIEDMIYVKNNCSQNLTKAAKKLIIL